MAEESKVEIDPRLRELAKLSSMKTAPTLKAALTRAAVYVAGQAKRMVYAGRPEHLAAGTGMLRNSIKHEMHYPEAYIGSNVVYARIHELGGTIRPKKGQFLSIPVGDWTDSPRNHPELRYAQSVNGQPYLVTEGGEVMYILRRQVTLPARPYLSPAMENSSDAVEAIFTNTVYTELLGGDPHAMPAGGGGE